jgi:hypothetical protein
MTPYTISDHNKQKWPRQGYGIFYFFFIFYKHQGYGSDKVLEDSILEIFCLAFYFCF